MEGAEQKSPIWTEVVRSRTQQNGFDRIKYLERIDLLSPEAQDILKDYRTPPEGFDKIGFTRPLGGFFYEFFYAFVTGFAVLLTFTLVLKYLYPYPESKGYASVGNVLFSFLFFVMNIPTAFSLEIFIAQYRVKNLAKMMQYIRFYIWYQMLTGIGLVTFTSIYVLYILKTGNLIYTKYLLLILISREYPAMTNVFGSVLKGLQRFDYQTKLNYITQIISPFCEAIFVLLGRYILGSNPIFGELMGIAIGYAVGTYVVDFISMGISIYYLRKVLHPIGYSVIDTLIPKIDGEIIKDSLLFGLKLSPPGFLSTILGFFTFFWWYDLVPAYATLLVLNETADQIANIIRRGGGIYLKGTISEALSNGKSKLTQYYIAFALKFSFMTMMAIGVILFTFLPAILDLFLISGGLENWTLMIAFITPNIISSTTEQVYSTSTDVILGGKRPGFHSIMEIAKTITQFGWDYLLLFVLKWPQKVPILILIWIVALRDFPNKVLALIVNYIFINKKLVRLKIRTFAWQTWIAPIPAAVTVWIMAILWFNIAYSFLIKNTNIYVAGGITVTFGFLCLLWVFFPLYTLFGGWDDYGIKIFTDAVEISGPSKFLFRPIVFANKLLRKSPLHNRFTIPWQDADREAEELMKERFVKQKINEYLLSISI